MKDFGRTQLPTDATDNFQRVAGKVRDEEAQNLDGGFSLLVVLVGSCFLLILTASLLQLAGAFTLSVAFRIQAFAREGLRVTAAATTAATTTTTNFHHHHHRHHDDDY